MPAYALVLVFALLAAVVAPGTAFAQAASATHPSETVQKVFDEIEKRIIRDYFGKKDDAAEDEKKKKSKGHGKGKSGSMPPGLAKRDLPADLHFKLKPTAPGIERAIVDDAVVLIERATGKVLDAIEGVVTGRKAR